MRQPKHRLPHLLILALALALASVAQAEPAAEPAVDPWAGQTFLADYSRLRPVDPATGRDYVYVAPQVGPGTAHYQKVLFDQPEVFISPKSPYKGAKPADIEAIAELIRGTTVAALKRRGYEIVDQPGPQTVYVRMAVTDLQIARKPRRILAYTPVGFAVDLAVKALKSFMDNFDILDVALQVEVQDSQSGTVLAEAVLKRGKGADATKPIPFDAMVTAADDLGERFACRLDNGRRPVAERVDCTKTRKAAL